MTVGERGGKMPCESCAVQFSVFKRKRVCCECERYYCSGCLRRGGGAMCAPCRVLSTRPLSRNTIAHLKVRDLQCFLQRQNVSTRGCVEKDELVALCVSHVNSAAYRRRGARSAGAFSSLKGFTNNINDFLNSAFDLRNSSTTPSSCQSNPCFNSAHVHTPRPAPSSASQAQPRPQPERFTTTPGGERDISAPAPAGGGDSSGSESSARVDTADCFEIEDLDDSGWEFVSRPADPLPNDSEVLITTNDCPSRPGQPESRLPTDSTPPEESSAEIRQATDTAPGLNSRHFTHSDFERIPNQRTQRPTISREYLTPGLTSEGRASSELELRAATADTTDTGSLQDEPLHSRTDNETPKQQAKVTLASIPDEAALEALSVRQLKELLARNRVPYAGCLERAELLARARLLWRDHLHYRDELESLPISECCKICMAAPLECVLLECGHIAACTACAAQLAECPICRQYVVRAVRCFRS